MNLSPNPITNKTPGLMFGVIWLRAFVAASVLALAACGSGGGGGSSGAGAASGQYSVAVKVAGAAPVASCPNGGIAVQSGIDKNGNGVLDPAEVTNTQYVCNGAAGASGTATLAKVTAEPNGANCANGGSKIQAGADTNGNGVLDASEVTSTSYICNGAAGSSGTNGLNTLMSITTEPVGANCAYGGKKIETGLDANANGILDPAEVNSTATTYLCNGAGVNWVNVTGTTQQAISNTGYLANNDLAQVTITLPATPAVGDVVQVTGVGAAGWKIAQNAGQSVITQNMRGNIGVTWTPRDAARFWKSVASSADGSKLVAAVNGGQLYTSAAFGVTWTPRDAARYWASVASSADGSKLAAAVYAGQLYTSAPTTIAITTAGITGWISGAQYDAIDLQCIGPNSFMVISYVGYPMVQ